MSVQLAALAAVMAMIGLGAWPMRRLSPALTRAESIAVSLMIGAVLLAAAIWVIGSVWYQPMAMRMLLAAACIVGLSGWPILLTGWRLPVLRPVERAIIAAIALVLLSILLAGLAPPADYDSLLYHLSLARLDLEQGRIAIDPARGGPEYFPFLSGLLSRLMLAVDSAQSAQVLNGWLTLLGGGGAALIVRRMGGEVRAALLAALVFISIRMVVWEGATAMVDVVLAGFFAMAVLMVLVWRDGPALGVAVLAGVALGGACATKYTGMMFALALGLPWLWDAWRRHGWRGLGHVLAAALVAVLVVSPVLLRNYGLTDNPLYPMFGTLFGTGEQGGYTETATGHGWLAVVAAPVTMFLAPGRLFDGQQFGAPSLLMFAPAALLGRWRHFGLIAVVMVLAMGLWGAFPFTFAQIRFLAPVMPLMAALAALGVMELWRRTGSGGRTVRVGLAVLLLAVAVNQALFVGAYAVLRLPPALGWRSDLSYMTGTSAEQASHYDVCIWVEDHLLPGEPYVALLDMPSFWCPQTTMIGPSAVLNTILGTDPPRFVIVQARGGSAFSLSTMEGGAEIGAVVSRLTPLYQGRWASVFDGAQVGAGLMKK